MTPYFKPHRPDFGSEEIPHHASSKDPSDLLEAQSINTSGLVGVEARLLDISKSLNRVGMVQLAQEIWNEIEDIVHFREMMSRAIDKDLDKKVKDADTNSKTILNAALAGAEVAQRTARTFTD